MAVFTKVSETDFSCWAQRYYNFRAVSALTPITEGVQNTNYEFFADQKKYVFTVFEDLNLAGAAYYAQFVQHLADFQAPVAAPLTPLSPAGTTWRDKPCLIVPFLPGALDFNPSPKQCYRLGQALARLHAAAESFPTPRAPNFDEVWQQKTLQRLQSELPPGKIPAAVKEMLERGFAEACYFNRLSLPRVVCHNDLHRGNVLWENNEISGIIDFNCGGTQALIFDLGICVCNWCFDLNPVLMTGKFSPGRLRQLFAGYQSQRQLTDIELQYFPAAIKAGALRYWLWRLQEAHFPRPALLMSPYDPEEYKSIYTETLRLSPADWQIPPDNPSASRSTGTQNFTNN